MVALQLQQPVINKKAVAWTIGLHALLLLLFILIHYTVLPPPPPPPPAPEAGGLEVSLGTSENGRGKSHPMSRKDPAAYAASVEFRRVTERSSQPKDIVRSTEADAPELKTASKKPAKTEENDKKQQAPKKPMYTYAGNHGPGGNSAQENAPGKSSGSTTGAGVQGVPGGTSGAGNNSGLPGDGSGGIGSNLSGRSIYPSTFEAEFHEGGKVVIHVTVDRNGNIIDKRVISFASAELKKIALEKLSNARFSKSNGPEPQQFGDVTITFSTRQ